MQKFQNGKRKKKKNEKKYKSRYATTVFLMSHLFTSHLVNYWIINSNSKSVRLDFLVLFIFHFARTAYIRLCRVRSFLFFIARRHAVVSLVTAAVSVCVCVRARACMRTHTLAVVAAAAAQQLPHIPSAHCAHDKCAYGSHASQCRDRDETKTSEILSFCGSPNRSKSTKWISESRGESSTTYYSVDDRRCADEPIFGRIVHHRYIRLCFAITIGRDHRSNAIPHIVPDQKVFETEPVRPIDIAMHAFECIVCHTRSAHTSARISHESDRYWMENKG